MQQPRLSSLYEAIINILIGAVVSFVSQLIIFPAFDIHVSMSTNLWILGWFTLISIVRSYIIRRWFNARLHKAALRLAGEKLPPRVEKI